MNRRWVVACAVAEMVGMTAAAAAARTATTLAERGVANAAAWGLTVVIVGGVVEGAALGWLQARALEGVLDVSARRRWGLVTVLVAGLGWAFASAPAIVGGDGAGDQPPLALVLLGALALGGVMGAVLGAAQASALRGRVRHPGTWIAGSAVGWAAAMPIIFVGATGVGATWPWPLVVLTGTVTGLVAGAVLGLVTRPFLQSVFGHPEHRGSRRRGRPAPLGTGPRTQEVGTSAPADRRAVRMEWAEPTTKEMP